MLDVPDGPYSITALQDYFEYIIKNHETVTGTYPVLIYVNTINNRVVFKIKTGYKLELLSKETMRLLGSTAGTIDSDKNSELVPKLESVGLVLMHCNLVNNTYQKASKVLFTFVPDNSCGQLMTNNSSSINIVKNSQYRIFICRSLVYRSR